VALPLTYPTTWLVDFRFIFGAVLFFGGWYVNVRADALLSRLKTEGGDEYRVPHGSLYELVSCPNYLGEIVEWTGWAILTWSLAGLSFALYTAANLVPRALSNHRWYQQQFPDYPGRRKAVVPFVL
jgi:steroid 5-alpha reductase family enzyme